MPNIVNIVLVSDRFEKTGIGPPLLICDSSLRSWICSDAVNLDNKLCFQIAFSPFPSRVRCSYRQLSASSNIPPATQACPLLVCLFSRLIKRRLIFLSQTRYLITFLPHIIHFSCTNNIIKL